jgi:hypothetical protein
MEEFRQYLASQGRQGQRFACVLQKQRHIYKTVHLTITKVRPITRLVRRSTRPGIP